MAAMVATDVAMVAMEDTAAATVDTDMAVMAGPLMPSLRLRLRPTVDMAPMVATDAAMVALEDTAAAMVDMDIPVTEGPLMLSPDMADMVVMDLMAVLMAVMDLMAVDMVDTDIMDEHSSKVTKFNQTPYDKDIKNKNYF